MENLTFNFYTVVALGSICVSLCVYIATRGLKDIAFLKKAINKIVVDIAEIRLCIEFIKNQIREMKNDQSNRNSK